MGPHQSFEAALVQSQIWDQQSQDHSGYGPPRFYLLCRQVVMAPLGSNPWSQNCMSCFAHVAWQEAHLLGSVIRSHQAIKWICARAFLTMLFKCWALHFYMWELRLMLSVPCWPIHTTQNSFRLWNLSWALPESNYSQPVTCYSGKHQGFVIVWKGLARMYWFSGISFRLIALGFSEGWCLWACTLGAIKTVGLILHMVETLFILCSAQQTNVNEVAPFYFVCLIFDFHLPVVWTSLCYLLYSPYIIDQGMSGYIFSHLSFCLFPLTAWHNYMDFFSITLLM